MTITLKTLPQATAQEVFDQVARHLLTQKARSMNHQGCAYRGDNGMKCAAGCLIADDEYRQTMEGKAWTDALIGVPPQHSDLIRELQFLHDEGYPPAWRDALREVAEIFTLSPAVLDEVSA